ncbi:hypothetical protein AAEH84_07785 [Shewanella indica]|uniref:hypothetical protein n=1 Tax=Shewanella TaxID=22 RepID=UPI00313AC671
MDFDDYLVDYSARTELVRYVESQPRFLPIRIVSDGFHYDLLFSDNHNNTVLLCGGAKAEQENDKSAKGITVNDCVDACLRVIGLKIHEIAKLVGVSRATLDLHRKGANVKDMARYQEVFNFAMSVEQLYGENIKTGVRNVLIDKKTLVQHLIANADNLDNAFPILEDVHGKVKDMKVVPSQTSAKKANLRLSGIGRMA